MIVGVVVAVLAMFFLFRDGGRLVRILLEVSMMPAETSRLLIDTIAATIRSNLAASVVAATIQGTLGGLAFAWLGLPVPVVWGVVMGLLSVFPFVGPWLIWAPAAAALAFAGRTWDAVLLVMIGIAVVHPVDNVLRPLMVAHSTKLNPLLVLVGLLGGIQAFGASGLILGPVLISVAAALLTTKAGLRD